MNKDGGKFHNDFRFFVVQYLKQIIVIHRIVPEYFLHDLGFGRIRLICVRA